MGEESSQNLIAPVRVQSGEDYLLNLAHADLHDEYIYSKTIACTLFENIDLQYDCYAAMQQFA